MSRTHGEPDQARGLLRLPALADLAIHPERVDQLTPEQARMLLAQLVTLQAPLLAKALVVGGRDPDELLDVNQAAQRLGLGAGWLYRHAAKLPFTVRVNRQLRFSARRLEAYIAARANGRPS